VSDGFKVGDEVVISGRVLGGIRKNRVARVLKRFVELEDGSRWTEVLDGMWAPYPRQEWNTTRIDHWSDEKHLHKFLVQEVMVLARSEELWSHLTVAELKRIRAVLLDARSALSPRKKSVNEDE